MALEDMISRFVDTGLYVVASFPFRTFSGFLPSGSLSSPMELEMSSLYAAAVFEKRSPCKRTQDTFFSVYFPPTLELETLAFLDIPDLARGRLVCKFWKNTLDHQFQVPIKTAVAFFDSDHCIEYDLYLEEYMNEKGTTVSPSALVMYLRWGGEVSVKDESELEHGDLYDSDSSHLDHWNAWGTDSDQSDYGMYWGSDWDSV
jgi:hypothetical protein